MTTVDFSQVTKGKLPQPFLGICYGPDGIGKSSLGSNMPNPIFINTEHGTYNLDVARFPLVQSFDDLMSQIQILIDKPHNYKSLVLDSIDHLEPMVWQRVLAKHTEGKKTPTHIEHYGFGKGYEFAVDEWRVIMNALMKLRETRKMNIMLIAHTIQKDAKDPTVLLDYKRHQLKLNDKAAGFLRESVDVVLFADVETVVEVNKQGKTKGMSEDGKHTRYLFTEGRPAFMAKNRFGLPEKIELDWNLLWSLIQAANPDDPDVILHRINLLLKEPSTAHVNSQALASIEKANRNFIELTKIEARLIKIINTPVPATVT